MNIIKDTTQNILDMFHCLPAAKLLKRDTRVAKELKALYDIAYEIGYNRCYQDSLETERKTNGDPEKTNRF